MPLHATIALALESRGLHVHHGDIVVAGGLAFAVWACAASAEGLLFLVVEKLELVARLSSTSSKWHRREGAFRLDLNGVRLPACWSKAGDDFTIIGI